MTEEKGRRNMGEIRHEYYEDEINLFDYILVLWKWKWPIVSGTLISVIVAIVITLQMPEIYRVSMDIEPGVIGLDDKGNELYMDSKEIIGKINDGRYNGDIEKSMGKASPSASLNFKANAAKYANLITVESNWGKNDLDSGLTAARQLTVMLSKDYKNDVQLRKADIDKQILINQKSIKTTEEEEKDLNADILATKQKRMAVIKTESEEVDMQILMKKNQIRKIEIQRKDIDKQIALKLSDINGKKNQIRMQQDMLLTVKQRIDELITEIKRIKDNTAQLVEQRDMLMKIEKAKEDISLLIYANTIQQNIAYFNQLNDQAYQLRLSDTNIETEINKLNGEISSLKTEVERSELHKKEELEINIDALKAEIEKLERIKNVKLQQKSETVKAEIARLEKQKKEELAKKIETVKTEIAKLEKQKNAGLQQKIETVKTETAKLEKNSAKKFQKETEDIELKIEKLSTVKAAIHNVRVVTQPEISSAPVKSSKGRRIILLSGVVALFMLIFLAFFIEYIKNARREHLSRRGKA